MRQTWEEIGIDLAENEWTCVGQLDDREITTSLGKRLLMVLSPFGELHDYLHHIHLIEPNFAFPVFLHLSPHPPAFDTQAVRISYFKSYFSNIRNAVLRLIPTFPCQFCTGSLSQRSHLHNPPGLM